MLTSAVRRRANRGGRQLLAFLSIILGGCAAIPHQPDACLPTPPHAERLDAAKGMASRSGHTLKLITAAGVKEFTDLRCDLDPAEVDVDNCRHYQLLSYFEAEDAFLVHVGVYEGEGYLMVDRKTGQELRLAGVPVFSPDRSRLVSAQGASPYDPTVVDIWQKGDRDSPAYWWRQAELRFPDDLYFCVSSWSTNEKIKLTGIQSSFTGKERRFAAEAVWNGWYWTLTGKPAPEGE